jgi:hypothetical protein
VIQITFREPLVFATPVVGGDSLYYGGRPLGDCDARADFARQRPVLPDFGPCRISSLSGSIVPFGSVIQITVLHATRTTAFGRTPAVIRSAGCPALPISATWRRLLLFIAVDGRSQCRRASADLWTTNRHDGVLARFPTKKPQKKIPKKLKKKNSRKSLGKRSRRAGVSIGKAAT